MQVLVLCFQQWEGIYFWFWNNYQWGVTISSTCFRAWSSQCHCSGSLYASHHIKMRPKNDPETIIPTYAHSNLLANSTLHLHTGTQQHPWLRLSLSEGCMWCHSYTWELRDYYWPDSWGWKHGIILSHVGHLLTPVQFIRGCSAALCQCMSRSSEKILWLSSCASAHSLSGWLAVIWQEKTNGWEMVMAKIGRKWCKKNWTKSFLWVINHLIDSLFFRYHKQQKTFISKCLWWL